MGLLVRMGPIKHSMKDKDLNKIVAIEKAISEKYGEDTVQNPISNWDSEKEKKYLNQMHQMYLKSSRNDEWKEKIDINGIKVTKKLLNRESLASCSVCGNFPKKSLDDVCFIKFDCCYNCYMKNIEDRKEDSESWKNLWRPEKGDKK